jgi:hypothetical protein
VTLHNEATRFDRTFVTDARGSYYFAAVQPGSYTVRAEIPGFKTVERKGLRISQNEAAGFDFVLEVGAQTERIEVTAEREMIQTQTGAREGLIRAEQIDNLSIISRSPMELLRILPGVAIDPDLSLESVSNGGGANQTNAYSVNGVRGSNNTVSLDGSRMIDVGSNSGLIIAPNTDFVSEVKVQSSNYAAEFGSGGVQISAITKGGSSEFHGTVYTYLRHYKFAANDRSNSIAGVDRPKSKFLYPGANISGPILIPGTDFNKNRDKAFFFFGIEAWRQKVDTGSFFAVVPTARPAAGDVQRLPGRAEPQPAHLVNIPGGFPGAGSPGPRQQPGPLHRPVRADAAEPVPGAELQRPEQPVQLRLQRAPEAEHRPDHPAPRLQLLRHHQGVRPPRPGRRPGRPGPRPVVELLELRAADHAQQRPARPVGLAQRDERAVAHDHQRVHLQLQQAEARQRPRRRERDLARRPRPRRLRGLLRAAVAVRPDPALLLGPGPREPLGPVRPDEPLRLQLEPAVRQQLHQGAEHPRDQDRPSVVLDTKNQNFQNNAHTAITMGSGWIPGTTGNDYGDLLVGRLAQVDSGTALTDGTWEGWNIDWYLQDSWKVRKNFTLEYGVRFSKWTNNAEKDNLGAVFMPSRYDPNASTFLDDDKTRLNGVAYASLGQVDKNLIDNRPLFIMPRVNFAWDIAGDGSTVVRGGGGSSTTGPMGNAEYDILRIAPNGYATSIDAYAGEGLGPFGLTYDTVKLVDPLARIGYVGVDSVNPDSVKYPKTYNASLSVARRLPYQNILEVGYVGTFGRNLLNRRHENVIAPGTLNQGRIGNSDLSNPLHAVALNGDIHHVASGPTRP